MLYAKSHEWVKMNEDGTASVGISDYAAKELGDLVFVNLPAMGDELVAGEVFADVESVKAVSDIYAPAGGTVVAVNEELLDDPAKINEDALNAWFVKIENPVLNEGLMDEAAYRASLS